jgi:hypothetical protein
MIAFTNLVLTLMCVGLTIASSRHKCRREFEAKSKYDAWLIKNLVSENLLLMDQATQARHERGVWRDAYKQSLPATEEAWQKAKLPADILKLLECNTP